MRTIPATILLILVATVASAQLPTPLRSGDIILTRNDDTVGNPNGYFNHSAIVVACRDGWVIVEMQKDFDTAIAVHADAFFRRCPEYCIVRHADSRKGYAAGLFAHSQIGVPRYSLVASLKPCLEIGRRDNCVSLVRRCYVAAGLLDPRWIRPDAIYNFCDKQGFRVVGHFRYADYTIPQDFYEGRIFP